MLVKINVRSIVADHLDTLVDDEETRSVPDLVLFYGVPVALALVMVLWWRLCLAGSAISILITALAIFAGLLFNLLLLTHDIVSGGRFDDPKGEKKELLRQVYANISYTILVAIVAILVLVTIVLQNSQVGTAILSGVSYFLLANFVLTLLMVLKRMHTLLGKEF